MTQNAGAEYKACVLPVKTLEPICTTGNNSPATRPEFVDISLNTTATGLAEMDHLKMEEETKGSKSIL